MGEPTRQLLLKPKELAERWGISERAALDIIKRTPGRVVIGLGERVVYRLPVAVAEKFEKRGGDQPWRAAENQQSNASTYEAASGGPGATTPLESDGTSAPSSETSAPRNVLRFASTVKRRIKPTQPGRSRSRTPSAS